MQFLNCNETENSKRGLQSSFFKPYEGLGTDTGVMRYRLVHRAKCLANSVNISVQYLMSNIINISRSDQYKDMTEHVNDLVLYFVNAGNIYGRKLKIVALVPSSVA